MYRQLLAFELQFDLHGSYIYDMLGSLGSLQYCYFKTFISESSSKAKSIFKSVGDSNFWAWKETENQPKCSGYFQPSKCFSNSVCVFFPLSVINGYAIDFSIIIILRLGAETVALWSTYTCHLTLEYRFLQGIFPISDVEINTSWAIYQYLEIFGNR